MKYRAWLIIAVLLFGVGIVLGLSTPQGITSFLSAQINELEKMGKDLQPYTPSLFLFLFVKNTIVLLASLAFSPILLIPPIAALFFNGLLLSYAGGLIAHQKSVLYVLAGIVPHGIFEIPALIIGEAAALSFGAAAMQALFRHKGKVGASLKDNLKYLGIAVGLLLPAAAVEAYITPYILSHFGG